MVDPLFGVILLTVGGGGAMYVNPLARVPLWASGFVTTTVTAPAAWAGVVAVMEVELTTVTPVAAVPPKLTVAPVAKFVPVMVTGVPPVVDPLFGVILLTVGGGAATPIGVFISFWISVALRARL